MPRGSTPALHAAPVDAPHYDRGAVARLASSRSAFTTHAVDINSNLPFRTLQVNKAE